jgi:alkanesulfonate monooxygenase SsuD/methylene tetrahydromethanopterin reductase-like flavin-dependent oxidoreductase (luciferase family)
VRVGIVLLPELDWAQDRVRWQRADEYGFDHAWTYDHLAWRTLADGPWHATIPTLVAAAVETERIRLGTFVATPNFRHPVPLAKELMTLDVISGGRLNIALGAGAEGRDAAVLGERPLSAADRHARFVEFCSFLSDLLTQRVTSRLGDWYHAHDARTFPGPVQRPRPPFLIAANGPRGMLLAATSSMASGDGWVTMGPRDAETPDSQWWAVIASGVRMMRHTREQLEEETGAALPAFSRLLHLGARSRSMQSIDGYRDQLGRARDLGFTDVVLPWPRRTAPYAGNESILDRLADELPSLRSAG